MLDEPTRQILATVARLALTQAVQGNPFIPPPSPPLAGLSEKRGCFVTLRTDGQLRGCLGCFSSTEPLYQTIADYTRRSACDDPRFVHQRITPSELSRVHLDISVLTPLVSTDTPREITLGVHGIHLQGAGRSGCYLPQVATDQGWSIDQFWTHCCANKAGFPPRAWADDPTVECSIFTADVIDVPPPTSPNA